MPRNWTGDELANIRSSLQQHVREGFAGGHRVMRTCIMAATQYPNGEPGPNGHLVLVVPPTTGSVNDLARYRDELRLVAQATHAEATFLITSATSDSGEEAILIIEDGPCRTFSRALVAGGLLGPFERTDDFVAHDLGSILTLPN